MAGVVHCANNAHPESTGVRFSFPLFDILYFVNVYVFIPLTFVLFSTQNHVVI